MLRKLTLTMLVVIALFMVLTAAALFAFSTGGPWDEFQSGYLFRVNVTVLLTGFIAIAALLRLLSRTH